MDSTASSLRTAPLLVIVGETASGKSALALELAQILNGELICADSWTVRREVNIGTAKPTAAEIALVRHHVLDVAGPDEDFTAAVFKRLANEAIEDITKRGKLPILVGGTGLYIDGVIYDFGFLAEGDRTEREVFNVISNEQLLAIIAERGIELGDVDRGNKRRLIRLIETNGAKPTKQNLQPNTLLIGMKVERDVLHKRIEKRVDAMIAGGLEAEVAGLAQRYGWDCEALKGVGYAQWKGHFLDTQSHEETRAKIIKATLDLAKRQRTWFKRNKSIHWFNTPVKSTHVAEFVTTSLDK